MKIICNVDIKKSRFFIKTFFSEFENILFEKFTRKKMQVFSFQNICSKYVRSLVNEVLVAVWRPWQFGSGRFLLLLSSAHSPNPAGGILVISSELISVWLLKGLGWRHELLYNSKQTRQTNPSQEVIRIIRLIVIRIIRLIVRRSFDFWINAVVFFMCI